MKKPVLKSRDTVPLNTFFPAERAGPPRCCKREDLPKGPAAQARSHWTYKGLGRTAGRPQETRGALRDYARQEVHDENLNFCSQIYRTL